MSHNQLKNLLGTHPSITQIDVVMMSLCSVAHHPYQESCDTSKRQVGGNSLCCFSGNTREGQGQMKFSAKLN